MNEMGIAPLHLQGKFDWDLIFVHVPVNIPRSSGHELACIKISWFYQLNHPQCIPSSHRVTIFLCHYRCTTFFFKMMLWPLAFNNWYQFISNLTTYSTAQTSNRETSHPYEAKLQDVSKKLLAEPRCIVWHSTRENVAFISECAFILHCAALRKQAQWSVCAWRRKFKLNRFMLKIFSLCTWKIWKNLF